MNNTEPFTSPLATAEENAGEKLTLAILKNPAVQAARQMARKLMEAHPIASKKDGQARIDYALDHWLTQLATQDVGSDVHQPRILWNATITRFTWFGHEFPGSAAGIDCPDNIYRTLALKGETDYELTGKVNPRRPAQFSFQLTPHPGADGFWTTADMQDIGTLQMLTDQNLEIDNDGVFRIQLGPNADTTRANTIKLPPGKNILLIRDTLSNWQQIPNQLSVRRTGGEALPARAMTEDELAQQTAAGLEQNIAFWMRYIGNFHLNSSPNTLIPPYGRSGAFGLASAAKFNLADDQAVVITVNTGNADYMGMQVTDLWGIAPSPIETISNYNRAQATANGDGSLTFIVSRQDTGYSNWVDTTGWNEGWMFFRWQGLPDGTDKNGLILSQSVVNIQELPSVLMGAAATVSPAARKEELSRRKSEWMLRATIAQ